MIMNDGIPHISKIRSSTIMYCYDELVKASERGDVAKIREMTPWTIPTMNQGYPLSMAALYGHEECVKELLTYPKMSSYAGRAMRYATPKGQHACVAVLAPWADEESFGSCYSLAAQYGHINTLNILLQYNTNPLHVAQAIGAAATEGQLVCLQKLLDVCAGAPCGKILSNSLGHAVSKGHVACVKELLGVVDPRVDNSQAMQACFKNEMFNEEIFTLLFPVSDAKLALAHFIQDFEWNTEKIQWLTQRIEREQLRFAVENSMAKRGEHIQRKI